MYVIIISISIHSLNIVIDTGEPDAIEWVRQPVLLRLEKLIITIIINLIDIKVVANHT